MLPPTAPSPAAPAVDRVSETYRLSVLRGDWPADGVHHDEIVARRNVLAALWAGSLMGLSGPALTAYTVDLHMADYAEAGDRDVLDKMLEDFRAAGLEVSPDVLRRKLSEFHRQALRELGHTD